MAETNDTPIICAQTKDQQSSAAICLLVAIGSVAAYLCLLKSPGLLAAGLVFLLFAVQSYVNSNRQIEIHPGAGLVKLRYMNLFGQHVICNYRLDEFSSVCAYAIYPSRNPMERVELRSKSGHGLLLGTFTYSSPPEDTFRIIEAPEAVELRQRIARSCQLQDEGFVGRRWTRLTQMPKLSPRPDDDRDSPIPS